MTDSACMANALLTKSLPKSLSPFTVISAAPESNQVDENGILNTVSIDRVTLAPPLCKVMTKLNETPIHRAQLIAELKSVPTKMKHA